MEGSLNCRDMSSICAKQMTNCHLDVIKELIPQSGASVLNSL